MCFESVDSGRRYLACAQKVSRSTVKSKLGMCHLTVVCIRVWHVTVDAICSYLFSAEVTVMLRIDIMLLCHSAITLLNDWQCN